ncbi:MAG: hypothetical protein JWO05_3545 [Gemmatimonadetes bacterium]|nr:hypothetical protein [Gemmatimonadota bacterium]
MTVESKPRSLARLKRALAVTLALLLAILVIFDPYTLHRTASDLTVPAPAWQLALGLADLALLAIVGILAFVGRAVASDLLFGEIIFALLVAIVLVRRDGVSRFVRGFGAEEFLSFYLLSILLRIVLLRLLRPVAAIKR